jgi:polar amino acid transport system substrate-binding protein
MTNVLAPLAVLIAGLVLTAGCGGDGEDARGEIPTLEKGTLTVGTDTPYPPFAFGRPPRYRGFDVDLVTELGRRLDLEVRFRETPLKAMFRDLGEGKFDMVASAVPITATRKRRFQFSDPYFIAKQALVVKKGTDIRTVADLADATVGGQGGRTGGKYAKETDAELRIYDQIDDAYRALRAGRIDAVIADLAVSRLRVRSEPRLEIVQTIEVGDEYGQEHGFGLVFTKGAEELFQAVNPTLREIKRDGTYARIYRRWFGAEPPPEIFGPTPAAAAPPRRAPRPPSSRRGAG